MNKKIAFTIVSLNYLSLARILGKSFKKHHPDVEFIILIVDKIGDRIDVSKEEFRIFSIDDLDIPERQSFIFKYNITELNTAVKPLFIKYLFEKENASQVLYIDPDIYIYDRLDGVFEGLENHDAVFTPHILTPMPDFDHIPNEISIMQSGCFNLGFVAMKNTPQIIDFLDWWWKRLEVYSISAPEKGLFTDQKWMDYACSLLDRVCVLRDPGYNVAYWNIHERNVFEKKNDKYFVNNVPLRFFHYSGFLIDNQEAISKFQNRYVLSDFSEVLKEIFFNYGEELKNSDFLSTKKIPYAYSFFDNNIKIHDILRKIYYNLYREKGFKNPFDAQSSSEYYQWLRKKIKKDSSMTNLVAEIYNMRPDVQKAYPDLDKQEKSILNWAISSLPFDYDLNMDLLPNIKNGNISLKNRMKSGIYNNAVKIERKYFVDSFAPFRFVKKYIGKKTFLFIKKRFYKNKNNLIKFD